MTDKQILHRLAIWLLVSIAGCYQLDASLPPFSGGNTTSTDSQSDTTFISTDSGGDTETNDGTPTDTTPTDYCEDHYCFGIPPTGQSALYNDRQVLDTDSLAVPGTENCAETPFCGQDAQYSSANEGRSFQIVESYPVVFDNLKQLYWNQEFAEIDTEGIDAVCERLNEQGHGGFHAGWRVPSVHELSTLLSYNGSEGEPPIDTVAFPNYDVDSDGIGDITSAFTASTPVAGNSDYLWSIDFSDALFYATTGRFVRCVRHEGSDDTVSLEPNLLVRDSGRFVAETVGTDTIIIDRVTLLQWHDADITDLGWAQALAECEASVEGGHTDWRLPDVNELLSLVVYDGESAPMTSLRSTISGPHWSSTTLPNGGLFNDASYAWHVDFELGTTGASLKRTIYFPPTCQQSILGGCPGLSTPSSGCGMCQNGTTCCRQEFEAGVHPVRCVRGVGRKTVPDTM